MLGLYKFPLQRYAKYCSNVLLRQIFINYFALDINFLYISKQTQASVAA
jgi:hypothetical protein